MPRWIILGEYTGFVPKTGSTLRACACAGACATRRRGALVASSQAARERFASVSGAASRRPPRAAVAVEGSGAGARCNWFEARIGNTHCEAGQETGEHMILKDFPDMSGHADYSSM